MSSVATYSYRDRSAEPRASVHLSADQLDRLQALIGSRDARRDDHLLATIREAADGLRDEAAAYRDAAISWRLARMVCMISDDSTPTMRRDLREAEQAFRALGGLS